MSLNDPRWGRGSDDEPKKDERPAQEEPPHREDNDDRRDFGDRQQNRDRRPQNQQDEDLEKLWKDFSDMLGGLMGNKGEDDRRDLRSKLKSRDDYSRDDEPQDNRWEAPRDDRNENDRRGDERPSAGNGGFGSFGNLGKFGGRRPQPPKQSGVGVAFLVGCAALAWAATGFYIVPEGQGGIVTTFGRYTETTAPGFRWHLPYPIQEAQIVDVSSVRTAEIGALGRADRLREALMLTDDENIVDVQFTVQYRIKPGDGARDYVFRIRNPEVTVTQAAESAMREVVGRKTMDSVLFESKAEIAEAVKISMQHMLDRYSSGIEVMSVAIQNAQPPQPVQAAFNDAVKAGQDRERSINLGEAYRNTVIPKAEGTAARLKEEAMGYKARIIETAKGDADRFTSIVNEYKKAPEVTRDRLYLDAVRDVMKNVTKVYIDSKNGNNLLYLPLDKIVNSTRAEAATQAEQTLSQMESQIHQREQAQPVAQPATQASANYEIDRRLRMR